MEQSDAPKNTIDKQIQRLRTQALEEIKNSGRQIELPELALGAAMAMAEKSLRDKPNAPTTESTTPFLTAIGVHEDTASLIAEILHLKVHSAGGHIH